MKNYIKKQVQIQAVQFTGENIEEIEVFIGKKLSTVMSSEQTTQLVIPTLEGDMKATKGDYIIKGIKGEFYPCKPDIFNNSYDVLEDKKNQEGPIERPATFGEKAVGITFNPSGNDEVYEAKFLAAKQIDLLEKVHSDKTDGGNAMSSWTRNVFRTAAFNAICSAQMALVKYLTWKD